MFKLKRNTIKIIIGKRGIEQGNFLALSNIAK